jgi:hypothetical protein
MRGVLILAAPIALLVAPFASAPHASAKVRV